MAEKTFGRRLINRLPGTRAPSSSAQDRRLLHPVHIVASPFKTGTTSVGQALIDLGVGQRDMPYSGELLKEFSPVIRPLNRLALAEKEFRRFEELHVTRVLEEMADFVQQIAPYDVFHDAPFGHTHIHPFIRRILAPEARFIWVNRNREDWLGSVRNWEIAHPEVYPAHADWTENSERRRATLRRRWKGHYAEFNRLRRVVPEQCLELEWSDLNDFRTLAEFYGKPVPEQAFPKRNISRG